MSGCWNTDAATPQPASSDTPTAMHHAAPTNGRARGACRPRGCGEASVAHDIQLVMKSVTLELLSITPGPGSFQRTRNTGVEPVNLDRVWHCSERCQGQIIIIAPRFMTCLVLGTCLTKLWLGCCGGVTGGLTDPRLWWPTTVSLLTAPVADNLKQII